MKLIRKLVTGLMILLVVLGSSPLEVFALSNNELTEWPTGGTNGVKTTLPQPPAVKNIVDLSSMFHYPTLDYSGLPADRPGELNVIKSLKGYVPVNNSSPDDDSSVAVITRDAPWQAGVMWSKESNKINLAEPFHMVSYVYLGIRGQAERNADGNRAGADGITFTIHNDNKTPVANTSGSGHNKGMNAYGALGNGLGVYGSNFSANTASDNNNMAYMTQGVTNGIALEFDTFYNHNNTTQHSDNDLWQFVGNDGEGSWNTNFGHIGINYLNELQNNKANNDGKPFGYGSDQVIKHNTMLAVGWDGGISGLDSQNGWQVSTSPQTKLADNKWHRLEVKWEPKTLTTGELTYRIYQQGHTGERNISDIYDTSKDGTAVLEKTVTVNVGEVFGVSDINKTVYWGFTGSTGYYQNNQAVQMLQLPVPYYKSGIRKVDQDGNLVKNAKFELQVLNEEASWETVVFQKAVGSETQDYVLTGVDNGLIGVTTDLDEASPTYGKVTATQLLKGTYRWVEIEAPEGYKIKQRYYPDENDGFELKYILGSDNESSIDFDVTNTKLSQIELYKKDEHTNQPLNGVKFTISKIVDGTQSYLTAKSDNSDFEWTTTESEAKQFETGKSYFVRNGEIVEEATEDGYIRIGYIENGVDLKWKEVSVPVGYDSSGTLTGDFTPSTDNGYVYSATQTNSRLYQVSLEKKASDTNAALPGAVFSLEQQVDSEWKAVGDNKTTDEYGKITISNLTAGTYRWKEVTAPAGYQISQPYFPNENGFEVAYNSNLEIDTDTNNYIFNTTGVKNDREFELTLEKLASNFETPLQGVEFKLYDSAGGTDFSNLTPKAIVTTDADGKIVLNNEQIQADKTYYLVESQTVDGFIQLEGYFTITTSKVDGINVTYVKADTETDESPFEFTKKDDDIYSGHLKIYNKRELILPHTGGNGILGYVGIGLTMTIVALLFFIARKRNFKWLIILIVATSGLAGLAGGTQVVSAQEQEQVQLEVNRLVYQPSDTQYKSGVNVN